MARKVENSKNFLIIEINAEEAKSIGFGIPEEGCICCHCNDIIKDSMFYIAVLNDVMCKECYDKWIEDAKHYPEDAPIEERNYKYTMLLLKRASEGHTIEPQYPSIITLEI